MPRYTHTVQPNEQGQRIDTLLANLEGIPSRAEGVRLIENGKVELNGLMTTTKKRILCTGDILAYTVEPQAPLELIAQPMPLDIRFEDDHLIVLSKAPGVVCHPTRGHANGTLVNALIAHCGYANLAQIQGEERPGIIHRLDKDTSGLMIVAKSDEAGLLLQDEIRIRNVDRRYLTLVHGYIAPPTGLIDAPIARGESDRQRRVVANTPNAKASVTTFTVLERFEAGRFDDGYTLLECKLYTGRTHQIRTHMLAVGCPLVGDTMYAPSKASPFEGTRVFLHSWKLSFAHPRDGAQAHFRSFIPRDLRDCLISLRNRARQTRRLR